MHFDLLPTDFPPELARLAFSSGDEVAWSLNNAALAVEWFGQHGYAVLGTELWVVQTGGIQSLPLGQDGMRGVYGSTVKRQKDEAWSSFVVRSTAQTLAYLQAFNPSDIAEKGQLYFNVAWVSESRFNELVPVELPRWVQIPAGLVLGSVTLLCGYASLVMLFGVNEKNPILAATIGFVLLLGCLWVLEKCLRLLTGRKIRGGLLSPRALRVVSFFFLIFPVAGLFTGYYRRMGVIAIFQALMYVLSFAGLQSLARRRGTEGGLDEDSRGIAPKSWSGYRKSGG